MNAAAAGSENERSARLSREFGELVAKAEAERVFDVVIVGSGYGGSVAAHALAGLHVAEKDGKTRPITVCVLERGKEYLPGEFPGRFEELPAHLRHADQTTGKVSGDLEGLFDVRMGDDVVALVANGLGGGSLINAGVMLEPEPAGFPQEASPALRTLVNDLRNHGWYARAQLATGGQVVRAGQTVTNGIDRLGRPPEKTDALRSLKPSAFKFAGITVSLDGEPNSAGVVLPQCNLCGDCMTGCNVGAKNSLDANLLEAAARRKVEIYSGASVVSLARANKASEGDGPWQLNVVHTSAVLQARELGSFKVIGRRVILAAGTLGSTEILLRSRTAKLVLSPHLGAGFSCNGDNLAAVYKMKPVTHSRADEDLALDQRQVGPTITGTIAVPAGGQTFQLQEFSVPGPMRRLYDEIVTTASVLNRLPEADCETHGGESADAPDPLAVDQEALSRTLLVGMIGHDEAQGVLYLPRPLPPRDRPPVPGGLGIRWPGARHGALLKQAHEAVVGLVKKTAEDGAPALIANPMWKLLPAELEKLVSQPLGPVLTVHPIGGCRIGPRSGSQHDGVVDEFGCVYNYAATGAFESLVVLDGSIIPGSLGANPALTITATAMRAMATLIGKWKFDATVPEAPQVPPWPRRMLESLPVPPPEPPERPSYGSTQVQIVERLRGSVPLAFGPSDVRQYIVEITLAYDPLPVNDLARRLHRSMRVCTDDHVTRLRIFEKEAWNASFLDLEDDTVRARFAIFEARLSGTLTVLGREASKPSGRAWNSVRAWLCNRGWRDIWQQVFSKDRASSMSCREYVASLIKLGTRAGEVRRLDYDLQIAEVLPPHDRQQAARARGLRIERCDVIRGSKRLTYGRRANPWRQLTELTIDEMPSYRSGGADAVLTLDGRFLAGQGFPLLRITAQRNHAVALAELFAFGLYLARVLISIHLWTFRKPDAQPQRLPERLPATIEGLPEPEITELVVDRMPGSGEPVVVRLTRYQRPAHSRPGVREPLVMLHGYSASGNTFTHPSLKQSAAEYFCRSGRDVWVVDLRTSSALPTCTYAWSMEQVGLIDIPAALLHICNVTGQRVDVLAHCIGCVMLSMAILTDAGKVESGEIELGTETWLTRGQLGTLAAFNGAERSGQAHPCIRKVVLNQKGPVLRYTDNNIFRAFVLQSVRRWLLADDYRFQPSQTPKVAEQLLDRFLASIPYPAAEYDIENPLWPWARVPWTATRHRMDALYGRAFEAAQFRTETLDAIDDLFGPINLDTVSQTIHFAKFDAITNQAGRGEFVTLNRLHDCWGGIETFAIHGKRNGLVDVLTQKLLNDRFTAAGVPFSETDHPKIYEALGHQDVLMGVNSSAVFDDIERFFNTRCKAPQRASWPCLPEVPWSGPRFDFADDTDALRIACLSDPTLGCGTLCLVPAVRYRRTSGPEAFEVVQAPEAVAMSEPGSSASWRFAVPACTELGRHTEALRDDRVADAELGWLALIVYEAGETKARMSASAPAARMPAPVFPDSDDEGPPLTTADVPAPKTSASRSSGPIASRAAVRPVMDHEHFLNLRVVTSAFDLQFPRRELPALAEDLLPQEVLDAVQDWLPWQDPDRLPPCFVSLTDVHAADAMKRGSTKELVFAVGSCQYVGGLLDRDVSQASLNALATSIDSAESRIDIALLVGDQIYADASAGLVDPVRRDELFDQPNDKALRGKGMRAVLRRVPVWMLLDDHELCDNWEPMAPRVAGKRRADRRRRLDTLHHGARAWAKFQRMRPLEKWPGVGVGDLEFAVAGIPFRLTDTRTGRSARGSIVSAERQQILARAQWRALTEWLRFHKDEVKFVATSSLLLPRRRASAESSAGHAHSDAWDGFPNSLERLMMFMSQEQITNTVFLSGDEHYSMVVDAHIVNKDQTKWPTIKITSVHSSALYAPFPFANGHPSELSTETMIPFGQVTVHVRTRIAPAGDGFARLAVTANAGVPTLTVKWCRAGSLPVDAGEISLG